MTAYFWQKEVDNTYNPYYYIYNNIVRICFLVIMKRIESRSNPIIKSTVALRDKKSREESGLFRFEGVHLLEEYLRSGRTPRTVFLLEGSRPAAEIASKAGCEVIEVTESVYSKLTSEKAPQGVLTVAEYPESVVYVGRGVDADTAVGAAKDTVIILDSLQDTGNVGTVIRTAASIGASVFLSGACADILSEKTVRATMGAIFFSDVFVWSSTEECIRTLQKNGRRVFAAALREDGIRLGSCDFLRDDCFIIGNEGRGISDSSISLCDGTVYIPMTGKTESLNAAAAAAMIIWEARRGFI